MARLTKRDVERLMDGYDADPIGALTAALRRAQDRPDASFDELVASAPLDPERRRALIAREIRALDAFAAELNESRGFS